MANADDETAARGGPDCVGLVLESRALSERQTRGDDAPRPRGEAQGFGRIAVECGPRHTPGAVGDVRDD